MSYKQDAIKELAKELKANDFRVFVSKSGEYGFYTNKEGDRVVSFGFDLGTIKVSGNYKTSCPRETGTGWRITDNFNASIAQQCLDCKPPKWAIRDHSYKFTSLKDYLDTYQKSSVFEEVEND